MNNFEWAEGFEESDQDVFGEESYYGGNGESAEFFLPAAGIAAARQLFRRKPRRPLPTPTGQVPRPSPPRQLPVMQSQFVGISKKLEEDARKTTAALKTLEGRLDAYSSQLAALQQVRTGEQSADLFRYAFTKAAADITPALLQRDLGQAVTHALPALVPAFSPTGRGGIASSFSASPLMTAAFPVLAGAAVWLLRKPNPPTFTQAAVKADVEITAEAGTTIRVETNGNEPTRTSPEVTRITTPSTGTIVKAKAFNLFGIASDTASLATA